MTSRLSAAAFAAAAAAPAGLHAQAAETLDPITIEAATRFETPVSDVSRAVTVIPREEVETQARIEPSLGGILGRTTPGFSQPTEALTDFGQTLRGRTFLTLIDGVPQTMPLRDGRRSLNTIDPAAIERIEVVRGGTALYGFGATGGLVNIVTRSPEDGELSGSLEAGTRFSLTHPADSLGGRLSGSLTGGLGGFDGLLVGSVETRGASFDSDGDRRPADPTGAQGGLSESDSHDVLVKIGRDFDGGDQRLEVTANLFEFRQDAEFGGLAVGGDPDRGVKARATRGNINVEEPGSSNLTLNLGYDHRDLLGSELETQVYYGDLETTFSKFPGFPQTEITSEKFGARVTVRTPLEAIEAAPFDLIWGVDYLKDSTFQAFLDAPDASPKLDQDAIAGFAQLEVPVGGVGFLTGGVRHEDVSVDASDFSRDGVTTVQGGELTFAETLFNVSGTAYLTDRIDLFAGFSQGFTLGDIGRSIADGTFATAESFESEAQRTDNYEIGLRGDFGAWDASVVGFYNESDNGTAFDADLNILKRPEEIYGVEVSGNWRPRSDTRLGGTFTWMEGRVDTDADGDFDEDLPSTRIPPVKVTGYLEHSPNAWSSLRLQALYSGTRSPDSTAFGGTSDIDDYLVVDAFAAFDVGPGQLRLGVANLLNADYVPVINQAYDLGFAYVEAPGATATLSYELRF